ncbi:hypothetical protein, partial [Gemmiger qucibialis]|uniref:hypothetical protein n=1 Tax=Gemmiger qucibialis TaxID=2997294 RepID=UPI002FDB8596
DRCPCFGSLFPPLAALTFAASSIICAFGLASAAPRSPERCLELCGIALVLFLVFHLQLFVENSAEDKPAERAAVEHLPAERHREVAAPGMHPCAKAGLLEQQGSHKAHNWHMMQTIIREMA